MRLIKPSFEIIEQPHDLESILKHIELCGKVCYKSEDNITEDSYKKFLEMIIKKGHTSVLEHGTIYLTFPDNAEECFHIEETTLYELGNNNYSQINYIKELKTNFLTTNYRVVHELNAYHLLKYQCKPTKCHERRYTVKFICDRGVSHKRFVA